MRRLLLALGMSVLTACLLGAPPEPPRYFQPELPARDGTPTSAARVNVPLRLASVRASAYLDERMVWRASQVEYGYYDDRRWTEHPAHFVERGLASELFEYRGLRRARAGRVPTLTAELLAFDEVLEPKREARVALRVLLLDERGVSLLERSYVRSEPIEGSDPASVSRALGSALGRIIQEASGDVVAALSGMRG